ncbi:ATP-binding protein, partial [Patescibacteria group bacterium]
KMSPERTYRILPGQNLGFREELFVGRAGELDIFTEVLARVQGGEQVFEQVFYIHGEPGVGKSWLMAKMASEARQRDFCVAGVNFGEGQFTDVSRRDPESAKCYFGRELISSLDPEMRAGVDLETPSSVLVEAAVDLIHDRHGPEQEDPLVLFFDNVDKGEEGFVRWVQKEALLPLLYDKGRVLFVMAGREQQNFSRLIYPLERRMNRLPLAGSDPETVGQQLEALGASDLLTVPEAIWYTAGLPGLVAEATRFLGSGGEKEELLAHLAERILGQSGPPGEEPNFVSEVLALALCREVESCLIREMLVSLWGQPSEPGGITPAKVIKRLRSRGLLNYHPKGYGYVAPPGLRQVLGRFFQQANLKGHFLTHCLAAGFFGEQVEEGDFVAIANRIFHLASLRADLALDPNLASLLGKEALNNLQADLQKQLGGELQAALNTLAKTDYRPQLKRKIIARVASDLQEPDFYETLDQRTITSLRELVQTCPISS